MGSGGYNDACRLEFVHAIYISARDMWQVRRSENGKRRVFSTIGLTCTDRRPDTVLVICLSGGRRGCNMSTPRITVHAQAVRVTVQRDSFGRYGLCAGCQEKQGKGKGGEESRPDIEPLKTCSLLVSLSVCQRPYKFWLQPTKLP